VILLVLMFRVVFSVGCDFRVLIVVLVKKGR